MSDVAIRHPKRGKAHRPVFDGLNQRGFRNHWKDGMETTACDLWTAAQSKGLTERIPVEQTAPEDRCKHCWPNP